MGFGLNSTSIIVWFVVVVFIPIVYILYTMSVKRKYYAMYEHFLAIGMIKSSLDYVYDEVKDWHITREHFISTFVAKLYNQIKTDYCNTFSGKSGRYASELEKLYILTKRHQKWYFITIRKGISYDCYKLFTNVNDEAEALKAFGGVLKRTTLPFSEDEKESLQYYYKERKDRVKASDIPNVKDRVIEKSNKIEESIYGVKPKPAQAAKIENTPTEDLTISLIEKYKS